MSKKDIKSVRFDIKDHKLSFSMLIKWSGGKKDHSGHLNGVETHTWNKVMQTIRIFNGHSKPCYTWKKTKRCKNGNIGN